MKEKYGGFWFGRGGGGLCGFVFRWIKGGYIYIAKYYSCA